MRKEGEDVESYLARIRKTIEKSSNLIAQTELRIAETDRMLEKQGLSREQLLAMHFSDAQIEAANAELKRRGLTPLEMWEGHHGDAPSDAPSQFDADPQDSFDDGDLSHRRMRFGMMMKPFQI